MKKFWIDVHKNMFKYRAFVKFSPGMSDMENQHCTLSRNDKNSEYNFFFFFKASPDF